MECVYYTSNESREQSVERSHTTHMETSSTWQRRHLWSGTRNGSWLQMSRLSLRNHRSRLETAGKLPIILEEFIEYIPQINKGKPGGCRHVCTRLELQTLGSPPVVMPKYLTNHWTTLGFDQLCLRISRDAVMKQ